MKVQKLTPKSPSSRAHASAQNGHPTLTWHVSPILSILTSGVQRKTNNTPDEPTPNPPNRWGLRISIEHAIVCPFGVSALIR
jgi:hypothetical protein